MLSHQDILDEVPGLLTAISGLPAEPTNAADSTQADAVFRLGGRLLVVEAKSSGRTPVVAAAARQVKARAAAVDPSAVPLLVVPFMGDAGRRVCDEAGVGYIDLSGNAHIKAPPLVVHVVGKPNRFVARGRPSSVFSPKSSRIVRLLLLDPQRWWLQRELAQAGQLGAGYVSRICKRLETDHLIERDAGRAIRPREPRLLLAAWQEHYDFDKHEILRGHVSARSGEELAERIATALARSDAQHAFTGLAAAWRLAPFAGFRLVTVFTAKRVSSELLASMGWREDTQGANLWLVRPNDQGVFHGAAQVGGVDCVSAVQAFLDLRSMPERSGEAAEHLKRERLPWA